MACACAKGISEHAIVEIVSVDDSAIRFYLHQIMLKNKNIEYYLALRPAHVNYQFIKYTSNKCTTQSVEINIFGKMPTDIARFLKLPNSKLYTGHCFSRTSVSLLANSGANLLH
ncbi:hypothetical protein NQ317_008785 [Molorchus minor]|uniref:Uncharacterized protein n=1 Tax=Molorchus minor TaxID=1323400 RepID=A0ABQ9ITX6_9CUCU|nr:hypothetical protein NQ317_008785 [Molorchus minor]